jgi:hypothetical protein
MMIMDQMVLVIYEVPFVCFGFVVSVLEEGIFAVLFTGVWCGYDTNLMIFVVLIIQFYCF